MECRTYSESLTALMDAELSLDQAKEVECHLTECAECHEEYKSLLDSQKLVERIRPLKLNPELWTRIHSEITDVRTQESSWILGLRSFLGVRWMPIAAATLGVAFLSLFFVYERNMEMERALQAYLQEREQLELVKLSVSRDISSPSLQAVYPNPFMVSFTPRGNPFKVE